MEGHEITIKSFNELPLNNPTYRLDSEYFKKEYLELFNVLLSKKCKKLESITEWITQGPNPKFVDYINIPCLTGRNINKGRVNYENADYVSEDEYENLKRFQLQKGDTLITLKGKGSIGKVGYVTKDVKSIFSRDIGVIRPNNIDPAYVNAYILSSYGKKIIERGETGGTGQSTLTASYLKNIDIPRIEVESEIGNLVKRSEKLLQRSQDIYSQAEQLLLQEVGLLDFQPSKEPVNVKSLSESFGSSGRLDAEYYQVKYEDYLSLIYNYHNGFDVINSVCNLKGQNYNPEDETDYKYIELSNIGKTGDITGCTNEKGKDLPSRARRLVNTGDVIISSIEGSLDSCALVEEEYNNSICSTGFYVIKSNQINSQTLLVLAKSELMQNIFKQNCSGTILTAMNKDDFLNIPIPIIEKSVQKRITILIDESFALKKQSEHLLEVAKRAVEIAIEENEEVALDYINQETN